MNGKCVAIDAKPRTRFYATVMNKLHKRINAWFKCRNCDWNFTFNANALGVAFSAYRYHLYHIELLHSVFKLEKGSPVARANFTCSESRVRIAKKVLNIVSRREHKISYVELWAQGFKMFFTPFLIVLDIIATNILASGVGILLCVFATSVVALFKHKVKIRVECLLYEDIFMRPIFAIHLCVLYPAFGICHKINGKKIEIECRVHFCYVLWANAVSY